MAGTRIPITPVVASVSIAALSLIFWRTPAFDPTAWLIWGRQLTEGTLHTVGGPSWKPLPVLVTTPFALAGREGAEVLWLLVSRSAGLLALPAAAVLARRLGGRGWIAAGTLALANGFLYDALRGDAEGLLVLLALLAVLADVDGHPRRALLLGGAAALIRPELATAVTAYGLWRRDPLVVVVGIVLVAAWTVPERLASGMWLGAATRAQHPAPGTPGQSAFPLGFSLAGLLIAAPWLALAGAVVAVRRDRGLRPLAILAGGLALLVAVMAEFGFTGTLRYLAVPVALGCVLGGVGLPVLAARLPRPALAALAVVSVVPFAVLFAHNLGRLATYQRVYGDELPRALAVAPRCGPVGANHFARQEIAWRLHLRQDQIRLGIDSTAATVWALEGTGAAAAPQPPGRARVGAWLVRSRCQ